MSSFSPPSPHLEAFQFGFKLERTASFHVFVPGTAIQAGLSTARVAAKRNMLEQDVV